MIQHYYWLQVVEGDGSEQQQVQVRVELAGSWVAFAPVWEAIFAVVLVGQIQAWAPVQY